MSKYPPSAPTPSAHTESAMGPYPTILFRLVGRPGSGTLHAQKAQRTNKRNKSTEVLGLASLVRMLEDSRQCN